MSEAWTIETLNLHLQRQIDDLHSMLDERYAMQSKAVDAALASQQAITQSALMAAEKAVSKAETAAEKRFEGLNEFRQTLSDQANLFITRSEAMSIIERNTADIGEIKDRINTMQGRGSGLNAGWSYLAGAAALLIALTALAMKMVG